MVASTIVARQCADLSLPRTAALAELSPHIERDFASPHCRQSTGDEEICFTPFRHQVSGHAVMICPDDYHICKPFVDREASFYRNMPPEIAEFTPAYCGELEIAPSSGALLMRASTSSSSGVGRKQCTLCSKGILPVDSSKTISRNAPKTLIYRDAESGLLNEANPWSIECQLRTRKPKKKRPTASSNRYIVLENLVRSYRLPCVLDLKMGTRQHGDGVNELKILNFLKKCERSTSKQYGLRIGGMQCFDSTSSMYQCVNKYLGETLHYGQMREFIVRFVTDVDGRSLRRCVCEKIVERLQALHQALSKTDGCRLYSASLLIVYDGDPQLMESKTDCVDVRLVDFAHSTCRNMEDEVRYTGADDGVLLGISTLISILQSALGDA